MAGFAMVEEPSEPPVSKVAETAETIIEAMEDEMAAAEREIEAAEKEMNRAAQKMDRAAERMERAAQKMAKEHEVDARRSYRQVLRKAAPVRLDPFAMGLATGDGHGGGVLVIPAEEIEGERLVMLMEDLNVMSRILEKKVGGLHQYSAFSDLPVYSHGRGGAQCIYLEDYGALFLMKVDFPLSPPVEQRQEKETEEPTDRVWEETRQEILTGPNVTRRRGICLHSDREHEYDADKVEELKRNLIKSLRHAANIRNLESDESVVLTVVGAPRLAGEVKGQIITATSRKLVVNTDDKTTRVYEVPLSSEIALSSPTVMTVRVDKSDVDALAEGEMDSDEFREKVQIFIY
jgi:hypothetical protein